MGEEYLRRTAITRPKLTPEQERLLDETLADWKRACNIASRVGWAADETRRRRLQELTYHGLGEETRLGSEHRILAAHQAAAALSGVKQTEALDEQYETSCPTFTADTMKHDARTMTLFDDETVSLATVDRRVRCELALPDDEDGYQRQYLDDDSWELTESTLTKRDGDYYLHLGFRKPKPTDLAERRDDTEDRTVLGVDLGIVNLAVTSTARFESGRELRHRHEEFERIRGSLQQTGTESAHRVIQRISGREERYTRDVLHRVANGIVDEAVEHDCEYIAFEDLSHIQNRAPPAKQFHEWAHRRLVDYVEYRADALGISVVFVPPAGTSRRCPKCGHTDERNRSDRSTFRCVDCGTTGNADYIAAKNVGLRYVRRGLQSSRRTGDGRLALKSGTVKPSRGFTPSD